jgi:hypothetical protein
LTRVTCCAIINAMNQRSAKHLRNILGVQHGDPVVRKLYRKLKKEYVRLPKEFREEFLNRLELKLQTQ